ncbi:MAG: hypothetical protein U1F65_09050 [Verrucomicrobiota bacterium]
MTDLPAKKRFAWEPLTPPGVAAFAHASIRRLWFVQLLFALLAAAIVVWFLMTAWFPSVTTAVRALPVQGEIVEGKLSWPGENPQLLADGKFIAFMVDPEHEGQFRSPAHVQLEFGRKDVYLFSLFGYQPFAYPTNQPLPFNRVDLEPKWGAWQPPLLWLTFGAVVAGLFLSWAALATVYCPVVWLVGFFANKHLDLRASWKLAGAALMPGATLLTLAILCYGLGALDLVQLTAAYVAHFLAGWVYLIAAPLFTSKLEITDVIRKNPFVGRSEAPGEKTPGAKDK